MHRPDPLAKQEPAESKGKYDPFRLAGFDDIDESDKHLPGFVERRRLRAAPAEPPESPEPESDADAAARLAGWEATTRAETAANGGLMPLAEDVPPPAGGWTQVPLKEAFGPPAPRPAKAPDETEAELTGLIADCRVLMRDVAMASARLTCGPDERLRFIESACRAALTGAKVGKMVGKLRAASLDAGREETRKKVVFEYAHTGPAQGAEQGGEGSPL